jgi:hypothetical protein
MAGTIKRRAGVGSQESVVRGQVRCSAAGANGGKGALQLADFGRYALCRVIFSGLVFELKFFPGNGLSSIQRYARYAYYASLPSVKRSEAFAPNAGRACIFHFWRAGLPVGTISVQVLTMAWHAH